MNFKEMYTLDLVGKAISVEQNKRAEAGQEYGMLMVRVDDEDIREQYKAGGYAYKIDENERREGLKDLKDSDFIEFHLDEVGDVIIGITYKGMAQYFWNRDIIGG